MGILDKVRDAIPNLLPLSSGYDPYHGEFELYESDACNFEVLDNGKWYKIDVDHLESIYYESFEVPDAILARANAVLTPYWRSYNPEDDPRPAVQELLAKEFDDVRFVNMTYEPGIKIY